MGHVLGRRPAGLYLPDKTMASACPPDYKMNSQVLTVLHRINMHLYV